MSHSNDDLFGRLLANELVWAADRVERDRNPGPLDPVHYDDPADVPPGLEEAWLIPSLLATVAPNDLATDHS